MEQQLYSQLIQHSSEHEIMLAEQPRTLLVTSKPLEVVNDGLLLTTLLDITERKRFERELAQRAFHDELTGLPNRALIQEMVTAELSQRERANRWHWPSSTPITANRSSTSASHAWW
ncbi:MAG: GGDEF domain-containing protein [Burkholderiales bacterium]|nr:GGDEF domain-containing protein [Burkholderiales bacterium]